jgi:hypothetical protein
MSNPLFSVKNFREQHFSVLTKRAASANVLICKYKDLHKMPFDFDVWLPTYNTNLQRPLCWAPSQKQEFIFSIVKGNSIPPVSVLTDDTDTTPIHQVIDGKQRINTIIEFLDNCFPIIVGNDDFYFSHFDKQSQNDFLLNNLCGYQIFNAEGMDKFSDLDKIQWFSLINFAGTPQDKKHQERLTKHLYGGII